MPGKSAPAKAGMVHKTLVALLGAVVLILVSCLSPSQPPPPPVTTPVTLPPLPTVAATRTKTKTPTPTVTPTKTPSEPTATNTLVLKDTPTSPPPTDTPIPPSPTSTPPAPPTRPPTSTTVPTRPAPVLVSPASGRQYTGSGSTITLEWMAMPLKDNEYYVVSVIYDHGSGTLQDTYWSRGTSVQVPGELHDKLEGDRACKWMVTLFKQTGSNSDGSPTGEPAGPASDYRLFYWYESPTETPTPEA